MVAPAPPRLRLVSAPVKRAITVAEAKAVAHIDTTADDTVKLPLLIGAATERMEAHLRGTKLITQTWDVAYDASPSGVVVPLPLAPVQSITSVTSYSSSGVGSVVDAADYGLDVSEDGRPVLVRADDLSGWPVGSRSYSAFVVRVVAGYGDDEADVPDAVRMAVALCVKAWYDDELPHGVIPKGATELVQHLRSMRLGG